MPQMLAKKILTFRSDVATARTPKVVLSGLQKIVAPYDIDVLRAGVVPNLALPFRDNWTTGVNLFSGDKQRADYSAQCRKVHAELGWDAISIKTQRTTRPFTFAEVAQEKLHRGSYVFEFLRSFGIVDGLFCPLGHWSVVYSSPQFLALSPVMRSQLVRAARLAIRRIAEIVETEGRARTRKAFQQLTEREAEVLQERARLHTNIAIAREMNISPRTVEELLRRARLKLDAPDIAIALLTAYKLGLITF
jgi:DNA-binding CsgD family transcriptional regulator